MEVRIMSIWCRKFQLTHLIFAICFALCSSVAAAQSTGSLRGTIADSSGAVVPNATVSVRNTATGISREVQADSQGNYQVPSLSPGQYDLTVTASGFATTETKALVINVGTTVVNNVK